MPFILPADLAAEPAPAPVGAVAEWQEFSLPLDLAWPLSPLHLPLTLLCAALVLLAVRGALQRLRTRSSELPQMVAVEKGQQQPVAIVSTQTATWLSFALFTRKPKTQPIALTASEPAPAPEMQAIQVQVHRPRPQRASAQGGAKRASTPAPSPACLRSRRREAGAAYRRSSCGHLRGASARVHGETDYEPAYIPPPVDAHPAPHPLALALPAALHRAVHVRARHFSAVFSH
ncbi:hypothetical protein MKEN_00951600 [Mycena kentingensis (nom. inval.)]|nr:hypothetical protein MKEN_00951600 [Mycena kentingensis (nom. inval.)]